MFFRLVVLIVLTALVSGCAQPRYTWSGYDEKLYNYYKNPAESEQFMEGLYEIIQDGETDGRVPPGLYAEYGYMLYERGKFPDAIVWYKKEQNKWPESRILMDKMIALANNRKAKTELKKQEQAQNVVMEPTKEKSP